MTQTMLSQPIFTNCLPDLALGDCVGSWLNHKVPSSGKDYSPAGNDGSISGTVKWAEVGMDNASGASNGLNVGDIATYDFANNFTIETWHAPDDVTTAGYQGIIQKGSNTAGWGVIQRNYNGGILFWCHDGVLRQVGSPESGVSIAKLWYHTVCIVDSDNLASIIINGSFVASTQLSSTITSPTGLDLHIGYSYATASLDGRTACANIYSGAKDFGWAKDRFLACIPEG